MFLSAFAMICSVPVLITAMVLISRHIAQRRMAAGVAETADIIRRLERIEQSLESSAVEIERIAESGRYMSRLLAEKSEVLPR
jgi:hypothetical protein